MTETHTSNSNSAASAEPATGLAQDGNSSAMLVELARRQTETIIGTHAEALRAKMAEVESLMPSLYGPLAIEAFQEYVEDASQRWLLFLDTLRRRGNSYVEREKEGFKPVLVFDYDLILDGRNRERPVNYAMVRIRPPTGYPPQREDSRPFVIIDPRAGHGSGIGGFKAESEVGVALMDGRPVYFVIFFPNPEPGQTLTDVCAAEAAFLEEVHSRHPAAPAPLLIGNCQGGWASMILAATHPDLMGPVVIAGAPLSYWAGEIGKNPLRYLGGLAGGAVPALLASDLGAGKFDGAGLVLNFETLNPAKTWWRKYYDVFAGADSARRRLPRIRKVVVGLLLYERERNPLDRREPVHRQQADARRGRAERRHAGRPDANPGSGDRVRLARRQYHAAAAGAQLDPRPLSDGGRDPRPRARDHLYTSRQYRPPWHLRLGQGCLKAAQADHVCRQTIEALAPGLYELMIAGHKGDYEVSFEARTVEDILKLDDGREEEVEFAAVARLSEWATKTYELTMRPAIKAMMTPNMAEALVAMHPIRQRRYIFSNQNPLMASVEKLADEVRHNRKAAAENNPFIKLERIQADLIEQGWNLFRDTRDAWTELMFHSVYATPWMKAIGKELPKRSASHDIMKLSEVQAALARTQLGGYAEAIIRMLILLARARGSVRRDRLERSNRMLHSRPPFDSMSLEDRTHLINEQSLIVQFAPNEALASLPKLLSDEVDRIRAVNLALDIAGPVDEMDAPTIAMFKRIQGVLLTMARDWHEPQLEIEERPPEPHREAPRRPIAGDWPQHRPRLIRPPMAWTDGRPRDDPREQDLRRDRRRRRGVRQARADGQ